MTSDSASTAEKVISGGGAPDAWGTSSPRSLILTLTLTLTLALTLALTLTLTLTLTLI